LCVIEKGRTELAADPRPRQLGIWGSMHQLRRPPISPSRYDLVAKSQRVPLALLRGNNNQLGDGDGCWIVAINQFELAQRGLERRSHYCGFRFENSDRHDQCLNLHPAGLGIARFLKAVGQRPDS